MKSKYPPALSNLPLLYQGKTRDSFETKSDEHLLVVATNRLSTHNIVHTSLVPYKGKILTAFTVYWLTQVLGPQGIDHHLVAWGKEIYKYLPGKPDDYPPDLHRRAIIVRRLSIIPMEMIWRAYLEGSLYSKFYAKGIPNPYGIELEKGLPRMTRFPEPIFTPTDKSETDDERVSAEVEQRYPEAVELSRRVFTIVRAHLNERGIELVDSKFEIGDDNTLADEVATPDSSRFVSLKDIKPGRESAWLDKQIARDEAMRIWGQGEKCPLVFSGEVIAQLENAYRHSFQMTAGSSVEEFQHYHFN